MIHLQFFISCVSAEFGAYRDTLGARIRGASFTVKVQEDFIAGGVPTLLKLDDYIRACDAVVHLVGDMAGAPALPPSVAAIAALYPDLAQRLPVLAPFLAPDAPALPYTQWEAWLALLHGRKLLIAQPEAHAPRGPAAVHDPAQLQAQQQHLARLAALERFAEIRFASGEDLAVEVLASTLHSQLADPAAAAARFGFDAAPQGFRHLIGEFVALYLGTADKPVPFGGRTHEIAALNAWLDGRPQADGAPVLLQGPPDAAHLLVHAPAGRGKTALLVRWIAQLGADWDRVFVPVSIRFSTNEELTFHEALAAQLAAHLHEPLPPPRANPAVYFRDKVIEYLGRIAAGTRRCLVVIDGLDEARGWKLNLRLPDSRSLRVLVSARELAGDDGPQHWLQRLGWTPPQRDACTLRVGPLTREGVADVLESMRFPVGPLSQNVDIVDALFRLSDGGDPLVLHFYANDLLAQGEAAARLQPEQLAQLKPGFAAYIRLWLDDQREEWRSDRPLVEAIFAVLASAHGPLKLAELGRCVRPLVPGMGLFTAALVEPLRRFIVGDGRSAGYVLAHPKLAMVLRDDHFAGSDAIEQAQQALAAWMREEVQALNLGTRAPAQASAHVLLYHTQQLAESGAAAPLQDWAALLEPGWRRAWEAHESGLQGYARDLEAVARALREAVDRNAAVLRCAGYGLGAQVRCALLQSSIRSIGLGASGAVLAELLQSGRISAARALHLAQLKPDKERAETIAPLLELLPEALRRQALASAGEIADAPARHAYLLAVAARLPADAAARAWHAALELVPQLSRYERLDALKKLRPQVEPSQWARVEQAVRRADPAASDEVSDPFAAVAQAAVDHGLRDELLALAGSPDLTPVQIDDMLRRVPWDEWWVHRIVEELAPRLSLDAQRKVLWQVHLHASARREECFAALARHAQAALLEELLLVVVGSAYTNVDEPLQVITERLGGQLSPSLCRSVLDKVPAGTAADAYAPFPTGKVLAWLIPLAPADLLEALLLATLTARFQRGQPLAALLARPEVQIGWVLEVLRARDDAAARETAAVLVPQLPPDLLLACLRSAAPDWLAALLPASVPRLPEAVLDEAVDWARCIDDAAVRARALAALLPRLVAAGLEASIDRTLDVALNIGDETARRITQLLVSHNAGLPPPDAPPTAPPAGLASGLVALAQVVSLLLQARADTEPQRILRLEAALQLARGATDPIERALLLGLLAPQLPPPRWGQLLDEAVSPLRAVDEAGPACFAQLLLLAMRPAPELAAAGQMLRADVAAAADEETRSVMPMLQDGVEAFLAGEPVPSLLAHARQMLDTDTTLAARMGEAGMQSLTSAAVLVFASGPTEAQRLALLDTIERGLDQVDDPWLRAMVRAAAAPHVPTARLWRWLRPVLAAAGQQTRPEALLLLALLHGLVYAVLAHRPALGGERLAGSPLARLGGDTAAEETLAAISEVCATWP